MPSLAVILPLEADGVKVAGAHLVCFGIGLTGQTQVFGTCRRTVGSPQCERGFSHEVGLEMSNSRNVQLRKISGVGLAIVFWVMGCAAPLVGPPEVVEALQEADAPCPSVPKCMERGEAAREGGQVSESFLYFKQACGYGDPLGCRHLADSYALGSLGEFDFDLAGVRYRWACEQGDGVACHSLGVLHRLGVGDEPENRAPRDFFRKACELSELEGCHDEAVESLRVEGVEEEVEERAVSVFEEACSAGLSAGCTNLAYMKAAGRGTARDHREALTLFSEQCEGAQSWTDHRLGPLSELEDLEVYGVAQYQPEVACEQLRVLVTGTFEERVISAVDAERQELEVCYENEREKIERTVGTRNYQRGRILMQADVGSDGGGRNLEVINDTLGLEAAQDCVLVAMNRHLDDGSGAGEGVYQVSWGLSFVDEPPQRESDGAQRSCDAEAVQAAVGQQIPEMKSCVDEYFQRSDSEAHAMIMRWYFAPAGHVDEVLMRVSLGAESLRNCLRETIEEIEIPIFESGECSVQMPLVASDGKDLHFLLMSPRGQ